MCSFNVLWENLPHTHAPSYLTVCHPDWPPVECVVTLAQLTQLLPSPPPTSSLLQSYQMSQTPSYQLCNQRALNGSPSECVEGTLDIVTDTDSVVVGGRSSWGMPTDTKKGKQNLWWMTGLQYKWWGWLRTDPLKIINNIFHCRKEMLVQTLCPVWMRGHAHDPQRQRNT